MLLVLTWLAVTHAYSGFVRPDVVAPLELTRTNAGFTSRYSFAFYLDHAIAQDASLTIDFPSQYSQLFSGACSVFDISNSTPKAVPCTIQSRRITLDFGRLNAGRYVIKIENVSNPSTAGSTSTFTVQTRRRGMVIDENTLYPPVGISQAPASITVALSVEGAVMANYSPMHKFTISNDAYIPKGSWFRVLFPSDYTLPSTGLRCYIDEIKTWLNCAAFEKGSTDLIVDLLPSGSSPGKITLRVYGVINPKVSGQPGQIILEVLREHTYTVLWRSSALSGKEIAAGTITGVNIAGNPLYRNSRATYTIQFRPNSGVPVGGSIEVVFPSEYGGLVKNYCYVSEGLTPVLTSAPIVCTTSGNTVTVSEFSAVASQQISIVSDAINPPNSGPTTQFAIKTYDSSGKLIDSNLKAGSVTISEVQSPAEFEVSLFTVKLDNPLNSYGPLDIFLHVRNELPATADSITGQIEIELPTNIQTPAGYTGLSCTFGTAQLPATYCELLAGPIIRITTPSTEALSCPFSIKITTVGGTSAGDFGFRLGYSDSGEHVFRVKTYINNLSSGQHLEEAEFRLHTRPASFASITVDYTHHTRDAWNVIKVSFTSSADIPSTGSIEFEFVTTGHSFPRDLGWNLPSYTSHDFPCTFSASFPDAASPGSIRCTLTTGTTLDPAYVRMKGFNGVVSAGNYYVWVFNVKNAPYAGYTPEFYFRTIDNQAVVLEEHHYTFPSPLAELPTLASAGSTVTETSTNTDNASTEFSFSIAITGNLAAQDSVYFVFPNGYKWDYAPQGSVTACAGGILTGAAADYTKATQHQGHSVLFDSTAVVSAPTYSACFIVDHQSLWYQTPVITVYSVVSKVVQDYIQVTGATITPTGTVTLTGVKPSTTGYNMNSYNLWDFSFTTVNRITSGGTIQVHFPIAGWASVDTTCYKIFAATSGQFPSCRGENNYDATYHRIVLYNLYNGDVPTGETYNVYFYATTGSTSGAQTVLVFSEDEDDDIIKKADINDQTITIANVDYPTNPSIDVHITNKLETRTNEWGPLKFKWETKITYPATTNLQQTFLTIQFPYNGGTTLFPQASGSFLQCRINGYIARRCTHTVGPPDVYELYIPSEVGLNPGTTVEVSLETLDATAGHLFNGFQWPSTSGDYRFIIDVRMNYDASAQEQAEPWLHVQYERTTKYSISSFHKLTSEPNILTFNFNAATLTPSSADSTTTGALWIDFPYSAAGNGFDFDLGMGLADGSQIDCDYALSTVTMLAPTNDLRCYLHHGFVDFTRIEVKNFAPISPGETINLEIPYIINPTNTLWDFPIRVRLQYEDLTDYDNPTWVINDEHTQFYTETSFLQTPNTGNTGTTGTSDSNNQIETPPAVAISLTGRTIRLNIENTGNLAAGNYIMVRFPQDFVIVTSPTTCQIVDKLGATCTPGYCKGWPIQRLFVIQPCSNLATANYGTPENPNYLRISDVDLPNYTPLNGIVFESWYIVDRKAVSDVVHNPFPNNIPVAGTCSFTQSYSLGLYYDSVTEIYRFTFSCTYDVPVGGQVYVKFPGGYTVNSCYLGPATQMASFDQLTCQILNSDEAAVSGLTQTWVAGYLMDIYVNADNPNTTGPTGDFILRGFRDNGANAFKVIDEELTAGTFTIINMPTGANAIITMESGKSLNHGEGDVMYRSKTPVRYVTGERVGPLRFTLEFTTSITIVTGYVLVTTTDNISIPTNAQMRCVWIDSGVQYMASDCTWSNAATKTITVYAPRYHTLTAGTSIELYITTIFGDSGKEGILFNALLGRYFFDVALYATGAGVTHKERRYTYLVPDRFTDLEIKADVWTPGEYTRITVKFTPDVNIPASSAGGRIVVEFPTITGRYLNDLGLSLNDNDNFPCDLSTTSAITGGPIQCWINLGTGTSTTPAQVYVTNFNAITAGTAGCIIEFPKIYNPTTGGDDIIMDLTIYSLDGSVFFPGDMLSYRTINQAYRIRKDIKASSAAAAPTVSGTVLGPSTGDYTIVLAGTMAATDVYVIELPSAISISTSTPTCSNCASCFYYSDINSVYIVPNAGTNVAVTISGITNPATTLTAANYLQFYGYHWDVLKHEVAKKVTYSPLVETFTTGTITINSIYMPLRDNTNYVQGYLVDYVCDFDINSAVPSTGSITIDIPAEYQSLPESACFAYYFPSNTAITGSYTCTASGYQVLIKNFSNIAAASHLSVRWYMKHPTSALTSSVFTVSTWSDSAATNIIETATSTGKTITSTSAPSYYEFPRQLHMMTIARVNQYAPIRMTVTPRSNIVKVVGFITITLNTSFGSEATGSDLVCLWGTLRSVRCELSSDIITMYAPADSNISTTTVITITTTNADDTEQIGIQFSGTSGLTRILVYFDYNGDGTDDWSAMDWFELWPSTSFTSLVIDVGNTSEAATSLLQVSFEPQTAVPLGGELRLYFPTKDARGNTLFADDLGTSLPMYSSLPCDVDGTNLQAVAGGKVICTLHLGENDNSKPAYVSVTNFQAISTGVVSQLWIFHIKNPSSYGDDDRHVDFSFLSIDSSGTYLDADTVFDVFTVTKAQTAPASGNQTPVATDGNVGTTTMLSVPMLDNTYAIGADTVYYLQFPTDIPLTGATCAVATCTVFPQSNILKVTGSNALGSGFPALDITFASALTYDPADKQITAYQWNTDTDNYLISERDGEVYNDFIDLVPATSTALLTPTNLIQLHAHDGVFGFTAASDIPATGLIEVALPSALTLEHPFCLNTYDSDLVQGANFKCEITYVTSQYVATITGFNAITAGDTLKFRALMTNPLNADNGSPMDVTVYADTSKQMLVETATTPTVTLSTLQVPPRFYLEPLQLPKMPGVVDSYVEIRFKIKPTVSLASTVATDYIQLIPSTAFQGISTNAELYCTVDNLGTPCSFSGSNIRVYPPELTGISNSAFQEILVYTHNADSDINGLQQPSAATLIDFTVEVYSSGTLTDQGILKTRVSTAYFDILNFDFLHFSSDELNLVTITFSNTQALASGDFIVVEFPTKDPLNNSLFRDDIGSGVLDNQAFPCEAFTNIPGSPTCRLKHGYGTSGIPARVVITGFTAVAAGTGRAFKLMKFKNPLSYTDSTNVYLRLYTETSAGTPVEERIAEYLFLSKSSIIASKTPAAPTFSDYNLGATYTLSATCSSTNTVDSGLDYYIFEFPSSLSVSGANAPTGFTTANVYPSANWIVLTTSGSMNCPSSAAFTLSNLVQPTTAYSSGSVVFKAYAIENQFMTDKATYTAVVSGSTTAGSGTPDTAIFSARTLFDTTPSAWQMHDIEFNCPNVDIPAGGSIAIKVLAATNSFQSTDERYFYINAGTLTTASSTHIDWTYDSATYTYTLTGFDIITATTPVKVTAAVQNNANTNADQEISVTAYDSDGNTICLGTSTSSGLTATATVNTFANILPTGSHSIEYGTEAGNKRPITLVLELSTTAIDQLEIDFTNSLLASAVSNPSGNDDVYYDRTTNDCGATAYCSSDSYSANKLTINFSSAPSNPLTLTLLPLQGLQLAEDGSFGHVTVQTYNAATPTDYYSIIFSQLASENGILELLSEAAGGYTALHAKFNGPNTSKPLYISVSFYTETDASGFDNDLGTGISDEATIQGQFMTSAVTANNCVLKLGDNTIRKPAVVRCYAPNSGAPGYNLAIPMIMNPAACTTLYYALTSYIIQTDGSYNTDTFIKGSSTCSGTEPATTAAGGTNDPSTSPDYVSASATHTFDTLLAAANSANDWFMCTFSPTDYKITSAVANGAKVKTLFFFEQSILLIELAGGGSVGVDMNNPVNIGTYTVKCYTTDDSTKATRSVMTQSTVNFVAGVVTWNEITNYEVWANSYSGLFEFTVTLTNALPAGGSLLFNFPSSHFSAIACSPCSVYGVTGSGMSISVSGTYNLLISGLDAVTAGTVVNVRQVSATVSASGSVTLTATSALDTAQTQPLDSGTTSLTIHTYNSLGYGYLRFPYSMFRTGFRHAVAADYAILVIHMDSNLLINMYTNTVPGYIELVWPSAILDKTTNSALRCLWNDYFTTYCTVAGTLLTVQAPYETDLSALVLYRLEVRATNYDIDGLLVPATGMYSSTVKTYPQGSQYEEEYFDLHVTTLFSKVVLKTYANNKAQYNLMNIDVTLTTAMTAASSDVFVVEFPTHWLPHQVDLFDDDIGTGVLDGGSPSCYEFNGNIPDTDWSCAIEYGKQTDFRPAKIILKPTTDKGVGANLQFGISKFKNPPNSQRSATFLVYSRTTANDIDTKHDLHQINVGLTAVLDTTPTSNNKPYQSNISSSVVGATATSFDIVFSSSNSVDPSTSGMYVFAFDPVMWTLNTALSVTSPGAPSIRIHPDAAWIVVTPSATLSSGTTYTFSFSNMNNPNYVPSTGVTTYCIRGYNWNNLSFNEDHCFSTAATAFTYTSITPDALGMTFGCPLCGGTGVNRLFADAYVPYVITFTLNAALPANGRIDVIMPNGGSDFQSVSTYCLASSSGFGSTPTCSGSGVTFSLTNFKGFTSGNSITVKGKARNPAAAAALTTNPTSLTAYYDNAGTNIVSQDQNRYFSIRSPVSLQSPTEYSASLQMSSDLLPVRSGQTGPLRFIINSTNNLLKDFHTVDVNGPSATDFTYAGTDLELLCKFIDTTTNKHHRAVSCTYVAPVYTLKAPKNTDIVANRNYILEVYSIRQTTNGVTYPAPANMWSLMKVVTPWNEFDWNLQIVPAKITTAKVRTYCHTVSYVQSYGLTINTNIGSHSALSRVELEFSTNSMFANDLGTGLTDGKSLGCYTDFIAQGATAVDCFLTLGSSTRLHPEPSRVRLLYQQSAAVQKVINIGGITNPATAGLNVKVRVKVYTLNGDIEVLTADEMIYHVIGTSSAVTVTSTTANSYMSTISSNVAGATGVTYSVTTNLGATSLKHTDYVLWRFPTETFSGMSVTKSPDNQDMLIVVYKAYDSKGKLFTSPQFGDGPYTGSVTWSFSGVTNPQFFSATNPVLTANVIIDGFHVLTYTFSNSNSNYVGSPLTITSLYASDSTNAAYLSGRVDFVTTFQASVSLPSGSSFKFDFPASFTPDSECVVESVTLTTIKGLWQDCKASSNDFVISNIASYSAGTVVTVRGWFTNPASTGPYTIAVTSYSDNPPSTQVQTASVSFTLNNQIGFTSLALDPLVLQTDYTPVRATERGSLFFTIDTSVSLLKLAGTAIGTAVFTAPTGSFSVTGAQTELICYWTSGTTTYAASSCTYSANQFTVVAPEYNDVTVGTWTIEISSKYQTTKDGVIFPTTPEDYSIHLITDRDGATPGEYGTAIIRTPGPNFKENSADWWASNISEPNILVFRFKPYTDIGVGVGQTNGVSTLMAELYTDIAATTWFANDLGTGLNNRNALDCFNDLNLSNVLCYILTGNSGTEDRTVTVAQTHDSVDEFTVAQLRIPYITNPPVEDTIVDVAFFSWEVTGVTAELTNYKEFRYLFFSRNDAINTVNPETVTYSVTTMQTITDIGFVTDISTSISNTAREGILWKLAESEAPWALPNYCVAATHSCDNGYNERLIILHPGAAIAAGTPTLTIKNFPTPRYSITHNWTGYVYKNRLITDKMVYSGVSFAIIGLVNADVYWPASVLVPDPLIDRYDYYTFKFRTSLKIIVGGEIQLEFGDTASAHVSDSDCNVVHGLSGNGIRCSQVAGDIISCTGFSQYAPADPQIQVKCRATHPSNAGTTTDFQIRVYGVANQAATLYMQDTAIRTFDIVSAPPQPAVFNFMWAYQTQTRACIPTYPRGPITIRVTPVRATYNFKDLVRILVPGGVTQSAGSTMECTYSNGSNVTPAETCVWNGSYIEFEITDQQQLVLNQPYQIDIYTRDATGSLQNNGFVWPNAPQWLWWYLEIYSGGTLREAAKIETEVCPAEFNSLTITPFHTDVDSWSIYDITYNPTRAVPTTGGLAIEFTTNNELDDLYYMDLGLGLFPLVMSADLDCMVQAGYGGAAVGDIKCYVDKALISSPTTPVMVYVYNQPGTISAGTTNTIRIVRIKNPQKDVAYVLSEPMAVHFRVWTFNTFYNDRVKYNLQTLYRVFDFGDMTVASTSAITNAAPTLGITDTYKVITSPLSVTTTLAVSMTVASDWIVYILDPSYTLPTTGSTGITCSGSAVCQPYALVNWILYRPSALPTTGAKTTTFVDSGSSLFYTPDYQSSTGYSTSAFVFSGKRFTEKHSFGAQTSCSATESLTLSTTHLLSTLNLRTYDVWTLTITPAKFSTKTKRIDVHFPSTFMWTDSTCTVVSGVTKDPNSLYGIQCASDCSAETCTNTLSVTNFLDTNTADDIVIEVGAKNPEVAGATGNFKVYLLGSLTDTNAVIEQVTTTNSKTISSITYPYDYWVDWPTQSLYDRIVKPLQYGEIWLKFKSRVTLPSKTGWYRVLLPEGFDIAPGGNPHCMVVHTDMPFDNYPNRWTKDYSHTVMTNCKYRNRAIEIRFPGDILREFYGVKPDICTYIVLTTTGATSGVEGYRTPQDPGCRDLELYAMDGSKLLEASKYSICPPAKDMPADFTINASTTDTATEAIYQISFTPDYRIPAGYYSAKGLYPEEQGSIEIDFQTLESYETDLAGLHDADLDIFCNSIKGLKPKTGESLKCHLTYGSYTAAPTLQTTSAKVTISNFEEVEPGTPLEIHLPQVLNPGTDGWTPQISVGVKKVDYLSQVTWLHALTQKDLTPVSAGSPYALVTNQVPQTSSLYSGSSATLTLPFTAQDAAGLAAGSKIVIKLPSDYENIPTSNVFANIVKQGYTDPSTETYILNVPVQIYPEAGMAVIEVPSGYTILSEAVDISLMNFVNPSHASTCTCKISYYSIDPSFTVRDQYQTQDLSSSLGLQPSPFSDLSITSSSPYASTTNSELTFTMSPKFNISAGSTTTITMETSFPDISTSSPTPTCSTNLVDATCSIVSGALVITHSADLPKDSKIVVSLDGVKNPTSSGDIASGTNGFKISTQDSSSRNVGYSEFPKMYINPQPTAGGIMLSIESEYNNAGVSSDISFTASSQKPIPAGSTISFSLPTEYSSLTSADACRVSGALVAYETCTVTGTTVSIVTSYDIQENQNFGLFLPKVQSPSVSAPDSNNGMYTSVFKVAVTYDGLTISKTDDGDARNKLYIKPSPAELKIKSNTFRPTTEAEIAQYTITLTSPISLTAGNDTAFIFRFPDDFSEQLIESDKELNCVSYPEFSSCFQMSGRRVKYVGPKFDWDKSVDLTFNVFAVVNPKASQTKELAVYMLNTTANSLIAATEKGGFYVTTDLPKVFNLTSVTATSNLTQSDADMSFLFSVEGTKIPSAGAIFLDWPGSWNVLFTNPPYSCFFVNSTLGSSLDCQWVEESAYRRTALTKYLTLPANSGFYTLKMLTIPTLQVQGNSGAFVMRVYDELSNSIILRSYPQLTPYNSVDFYNSGKRIYNKAQGLKVVQGTYSAPFEISLEDPSYYYLELYPFSDQPTLEFEPSRVKFQYVWNQETTLIVGTLATQIPGIYLARWNKTEELNGRLYQPMENFNIEVVEAQHQIMMYCEAITPTPISSTSIPIKVSLEHAPYDGLTVLLNTTAPYQNSSVLINPQALEFAKGEKEKTFTLTIIEGAVAGEIMFTLGGLSAKAYKPYKDTVKFVTLAPDTEIPWVQSMRVQSLSRTSAAIRIQISEPAIVYYVFALRGSDDPTSIQVMLGSGMRTDAYQITGSIATMPQSKITLLELNELTDNTEYTLWITAKDGSGLFSMEPTRLDFKTNPSYYPARFKLFTNYVSPVDDVREVVAQALAVPKDLFVFTGPEPGTTSRRLQEAGYTRTYSYEFTLFMNRTYPYSEPMTLLKKLPLKTSFLTSRIPHYVEKNLADYITEVTLLKPEFTSDLSFIEYGVTSTFGVDLNVAGTVYGLIMPANKRTPSSVQIRNGLDAHNLKVQEGHFNLTSIDQGQTALVTFSNLTLQQRYTVHLTAENTLPGNPELMEDYQVLHKDVVIGPAPNEDFYFEFEYLNNAIFISAALAITALV